MFFLQDSVLKKHTCTSSEMWADINFTADE